MQQSPLLEPPGASASLLHSGLHCVPAPVLFPLTLPLLVPDIEFVCSSKLETCLTSCEGHGGAMKAACNDCCPCLLGSCSWQDGAHLQLLL